LPFLSARHAAGASALRGKSWKSGVSFEIPSEDAPLSQSAADLRVRNWKLFNAMARGLVYPVEPDVWEPAHMPGKRALSLITFDIDDTLYSSTEFARMARENAIKGMIQAGLKMGLAEALAELDEVVAEFTSNDEHHFDRLLQRMSPAALDGINPALLIAAGVAAYRDTVHDSLLIYEDARECLKRFQALGYRLGVVSQGWTVKQAEKLVRLRILQYLDKRAIFFSDQLGTSKSNPKFYQRAAEHLKIKASESMHIGDRPDRDIDSANQAGWITVLSCRSGRYHQRQGITPAAFTIHNFWDLLEIIERDFCPA
jgi:putative hydrolase of the HAD superfamily